MEKTILIQRVQTYAERKGLTLGDQLGFGVHGIVFSAKNQTKNGRAAIKVHEREIDFMRERDAYLRLQEHDITEISGCNVPELIAFDDDLFILEMTLVDRPFVLDFGGAFLDHSPGFSEEVLAEWHAEKAEQFGKLWPAAHSILRFLEGIGIYVVDVNTNNISWPD